MIVQLLQILIEIVNLQESVTSCVTGRSVRSARFISYTLLEQTKRPRSNDY